MSALNVNTSNIYVTNCNTEARETSMQAWLENITVDLKDLEVCTPSN